MKRLAKLVNRVVNSELSPLIWLLLAVDLLIGFYFSTGIGMANTESVLYTSGVVFNRSLWGSLILGNVLIGMYGLIKRKLGLVKFCGLFGFMLWTFVMISLAIHGHLYTLTAIYSAHWIYYALLYFGAVTKDIFRERVYRR
jgi:hypothetical protein